MKSLGIAVAMTLWSSGGAQAGEWASVAENHEAIIGVDRSTLLREGNVATVWTVFAFYEPMTAGPSPLDYFLMRVRFDCVRHTQATLSFAGYRHPRVLVNSESTPNARDTETIPETTWAMVAEKVCAGVPDEGWGDHESAHEFARIVRDIAPEVLASRR